MSAHWAVAATLDTRISNERMQLVEVRGSPLFRRLMVGAAFLAAAGCEKPSADPEASTTGSSDSTQGAELPENHSFRWAYASSTDPMTDELTRTACIISSNALRQDPPYRNTRLRLCLRDHPQHGREAYVQMLENGQFLYRSYITVPVKVRFDGGPVEQFPAIGAADGSTNVFFITDRSRLEQRVAQAGVTRIQPEVYQAGVQAISFDTRGFAWPEPTRTTAGR